MMSRPNRIDRPKSNNRPSGLGRASGIDWIDKRLRLALLRIGPPASPGHSKVFWFHSLT